MNKNLVDAQDAFLGRVNQICNKFGLNNIMIQLYTILYLSDKVLSLNDMTERLKISKGSASINIRKLERYSAVKRVWVKGSRRDYYEAESDISRVIMDRFKSIAQNRISEIDDMINVSYRVLSSVNASDKEAREAVKVFKQRLDTLSSLQSNARSLFNLFNSGLLNSIMKANANRNDKIEALMLK